MKTTWTPVALVFWPAREPVGHARGERVDQPRRVVIARDVLELDLPAMQVETVRDPLLVLRHRQRAEVRGENESDCPCDAVLDHLADDVLDPRRPVPHPEVAAIAVAELLGESVDLLARDLEQRRAAADRAVVLGDLLDYVPRRRAAGADVREIAGNLVERSRGAVGHDQNAGGHADVRSRTCSTRRRTLSTGVCGTRP